VLVFAATVGVGVDRAIAKYSRIAPSKAFMLSALGAERIEALCDAFCREYAFEKNVALTPRFSSGYGDCPLDVQRQIFYLLDCPKNIGLTLNDSMLMSPTKSVTAFVGIKEK
jgi:cobalamin-dependent methionine synthase I